jgi:putative ABC transport system ATP-binding protein
MENISKIYQTGAVSLIALDSVSVSITQGEFLSIMGPSGSGKSTLMNILGCLDAPSSGKYFLDGDDVSGLDRNQQAKIRSQKIGFVFQGFNLLPRMTAVQNVELPLIYGGIPISARKKYALRALELVGLTERSNHLPSQLSGGQQQRVAIARALVNDPGIILADEPTGNLDSKTSNEIMSVFRLLNKEHRITFIMVTHDPEVAQVTDRIIHIRDGKIADDQLRNIPDMS